MNSCQLSRGRITVAFIVFWFFIFFDILHNSSNAAEKSESGRTPANISLQQEMIVNPLKPPDTSSPRATLKSFLDNTNAAYSLTMAAHKENMKSGGLLTPPSIRHQQELAQRLFNRAVYCLNLQEVPDAIKKSWGIEGVLFIKEIFDRIALPPLDEIPDINSIKAQKAKNELSGWQHWRLPNTEIVLSRVEKGPRQGQFLFAPEIIPRLDEFFEKAKHLPYKSGPAISRGFLKFYDTTPGGITPPKWSRWLPAWSNSMVYFTTIWQWCALAILLIIPLLLFWILYRWSSRKSNRLTREQRSWGRAIQFLAGALVSRLVLYFLVEHVGLSGPVLTVMNITLQTLFWLLMAVAIQLTGNALGRTLTASSTIDSRGINAGLIHTTCSFTGFILAVVLIFYGFSKMGVSLIPLLTGLGVGGLAVALAARPTLENLIGGFTILLDRPYRVGQRVMVKGYEGDVERIGWRSTRIRLLSGHQVTIPNEEMARLDIENIGRRPFIRRLTNITITYDTPPEKVDRAVRIIKDILAGYDCLDPDRPSRVFFNEFNADSLNIVVRYWFKPPILWEALEFDHKVNLEIMQAFEKEGIEFAFPTTTNYLTQENGQPLEINVSGARKLEDPS